MKREHCSQFPSRVQFGLVLGLAMILAGPASALTTDNPYSAIAIRNAFALKPPVVATNTTTTPVIAPVGIELQGIHTILGKAQVFLKIKLPPRPPKPAEDQSVVLEAGQREGDVEVLSIDPAAGVVRLKNRGDELALNMIDNAATPTAAPVTAPALPGLTLPRPPGLPAPAGVIPKPNPTATAPGGVSATTIGGASSRSTPSRTVPALPSRNVRAGAGAASTQSIPNDARRLSLEEQMALIAIEKERTREAVGAGKMPPLPPIPGLPE